MVVGHKFMIFCIVRLICHALFHHFILFCLYITYYYYILLYNYRRGPAGLPSWSPARGLHVPGCLFIHQNRLFFTNSKVQILATQHCGRRCNRMEGGRGTSMSVSEVNLTPEPEPSMNSVLLPWAPSIVGHNGS